MPNTKRRSDVPEETLASALLHDVVEDYPVSIAEIERLFGKKVSRPVEMLSKVIEGHKKPTDSYYREVSSCPIASVVKGSDRINNIQTMTGVFSDSKQKEYIQECEDYTLVMVKSARLSFPEQEPIYENIKLVLQSQNALIKAMHEGKK